MQKTICLLCFLILRGLVAAQSTPLFQMTIHFEDAIGNKDSCTVGFDPTATQYIDAQFGETTLTEPFDSIFEVRVAGKVSLWDFSEVSKKQIMPGEYLTHPSWPPPINGCFVGGPVFFFIKTAHWPVKISWNRKQLRENICINCTYLITNRRIDFEFPPYFIDPPVIACAAVDSSYQVDLSEPDYHLYPDFHYYLAHPSEGNPSDTIFAVKMSFSADSYGNSPVACVDAAHIFVSDEEPLVNGSVGRILLFPNPSSSFINIQVEEGTCLQNWAIYASDGSKIKEGALTGGYSPKFGIEIGNIPPGVYFLKMTGCGGKSYANAFVKQ